MYGLQKMAVVLLTRMREVSSMRMRSAAGLVLLLAMTASCKSTAPSTNPPIQSGSGSTVRIQGDAYSNGDSAFSPLTLNTTVGTTVIWTNNDSVTHSVVSDTGIFNAPTLAANGTFSFTFTTAGSYPYKCTIHPQMTANVIVR
jgi:plastocyanin